MNIETKILRMAEKMDQECENRNFHEFVGKHEAFAKLAIEAIGEDFTLGLFKKLPKSGFLGL